MAGLDDAQGIDELRLEEAAAPAFPGQRGKCDGNVEAAERAAVVGFQAPEGDQHGLGHASFRLNRIEQAGVLGQHGFAARELRRGETPPQIIGKGLQEFRLAAVKFHHALDRLRAGECRIQRGG